MWLIVSAVCAIGVTAVWSYAPKKYKLDNLALMLWGLTLLVFVDHTLGYEGGAFVEMETEGLIESGTVLGIVMVIPLFIIWEIQLIWHKFRNEADVR